MAERRVGRNIIYEYQIDNTYHFARKRHRECKLQARHVLMVTHHKVSGINRNLFVIKNVVVYSPGARVSRMLVSVDVCCVVCSCVHLLCCKKACVLRCDLVCFIRRSLWG